MAFGDLNPASHHHQQITVPVDTIIPPTVIPPTDVEKQAHLDDTSTAQTVVNRFSTAFDCSYTAAVWILYLWSFIFTHGITHPQSPFKLSTLPMTLAMVFMTRATYLRINARNEAGSHSWSFLRTEYLILTGLSMIFVLIWAYCDVLRQRNIAINALYEVAKIFEEYGANATIPH